jgi:fatty-acid desaturase
MNSHPEELALARAYSRDQRFEELSAGQISQIMDRGRALHKWFKAHKALHSAIGLGVIAFLLGADYLVLLRLPRLFLSGTDYSWGVVLLSSCVAGSLHSYLMYSLVVYSLHEGAAHKAIFLPEGPFSGFAHAIASNLCRLAAGEPEFYSRHHMAHHAKFGTEEDGEFLNFVVPRRYWMTFFPLAAFINFTDFVIHRPPTYTRSRVISAFLSASYNLIYGYFLYRAFGLAFTLLTMLVFLPHVGFYLDRLRQFTEHNLMPLDNRNGSRSFGIGFWGLLVGGGPWGSPCHWEHHLVVSLPWYQQLMLHRYVVQLLTPRQREQFLIQPVIGFPRLWWRLIQDSRSFLRHSAT